MREAILTQNDELEADLATPDAARYENDAGDIVLNFTLTSVLGSRGTNEFRVGRVQESLLQGPRVIFDDNWKFIGFGQLDPLTLGPQNSHPDYIAGNRNTYAQKGARHHLRRQPDVHQVRLGGRAYVQDRVRLDAEPVGTERIGCNFVGNYMFSDEHCLSTRTTHAAIRGGSSLRWGRWTSTSSTIALARTFRTSGR